MSFRLIVLAYQFGFCVVMLDACVLIFNVCCLDYVMFVGYWLIFELSVLFEFALRFVVIGVRVLLGYLFFICIC